MSSTADKPYTRAICRNVCCASKAKLLRAHWQGTSKPSKVPRSSGMPEGPSCSQLQRYVAFLPWYDFLMYCWQTERAWTIAAAGTFEVKAAAFAEKGWSSKVLFYLCSISRLPDENWLNINMLAFEHKQRLQRPVAMGDVIEIDDDEDNVMCSDSETEDDSEACADVIVRVHCPSERLKQLTRCMATRRKR